MQLYVRTCRQRVERATGRRAPRGERGSVVNAPDAYHQHTPGEPRRNEPSTRTQKLARPLRFDRFQVSAAAKRLKPNATTPGLLFVTKTARNPTLAESVCLCNSLFNSTLTGQTRDIVPCTRRCSTREQFVIRLFSCRF